MPICTYMCGIKQICEEEMQHKARVMYASSYSLFRAWRYRMHNLHIAAAADVAVIWLSVRVNKQLLKCFVPYFPQEAQPICINQSSVPCDFP